MNLARADKTLKILALGDSYTIGQSVTDDQRWPVQLVKALKKQQTQVHLDIIAATGWTTLDLEAAIATRQLQTPYDLVTLLIGVNDQFRGGSADAYKENFARLLQAAIDYAGGGEKNVIVLSIPDYGVTPFAQRYNPQAISQAIESFNAVNRRISKQAGVAYVDITPISKQAVNDPTLIAFDGLHPSARMYEKWVEKLLPFIDTLPALSE